ncbi:uncharacterized protein BJX67DRAFT_152442 [Aspergillus lucknowensis]|uniref:Secreted protein n=1 Tax=Aspergillus lucknowensis TaxID=176173 RepID=A0ABR4LNA0_9EURO
MATAWRLLLLICRFIGAHPVKPNDNGRKLPSLLVRSAGSRGLRTMDHGSRNQFGHIPRLTRLTRCFVTRVSRDPTVGSPYNEKHDNKQQEAMLLSWQNSRQGKHERPTKKPNESHLLKALPRQGPEQPSPKRLKITNDPNEHRRRRSLKKYSHA